jgi:UDP-2-acetamido-3-amino-2,3-dideoxy-glucuronate N-acetyltransferase
MTATAFFAHATAVVDEGCTIGDRTKIWHFSHVMSGAAIGVDCTLGQNVFIASGVRIGDRVKIQNNVSVYEGVVLEDDVFCGPSCVFTNVINPRSEVARRGKYDRTVVRRGASIGANATIVCGSTIGRYALIGAGAVVARGDVPDYARMIGVPARQQGWVSRHGHTLRDADADRILRCPESGWRYREESSTLLRCLDWAEESALAESQPIANKS